MTSVFQPRASSTDVVSRAFASSLNNNKLNDELLTPDHLVLYATLYITFYSTTNLLQVNYRLKHTYQKVMLVNKRQTP